MAVIIEMLSFSFMVRAVVVGLLVSLCAALLGVSLVLKRYAMIGTALGNVGFAALVSATAVGMYTGAAVNALGVSIPVVLAAAVCLLRLSENSKIKGDSAVALISAGSLAFGVVVVSSTTGLTTHVCNAMFGSILLMTRADLHLSVTLSVVVSVIFVLFYKQLFAVTYDETFARATGTNTGVYKTLLAVLTGVTVVLGMRMMGALLIASLIIFPPLSAMRLCKSFLSVVITSAAVAVACFFIGIVLSFQLGLPPGAAVVSVNLAVFLLFSGAGVLAGARAKGGGERGERLSPKLAH